MPTKETSPLPCKDRYEAAAGSNTHGNMLPCTLSQDSKQNLQKEMLNQHEVLAAHQALCNSQGDQQPNQPGTATSGTGAVLSPRLHPQQDPSCFVGPQLFQTVFQSYRNPEIFHYSFKAGVHSHPPHHNGRVMCHPAKALPWDNCHRELPPPHTATSHHQHSVSLSSLCRLQATVNRSSGVAQENTQRLYLLPFNHPC